MSAPQIIMIMWMTAETMLHIAKDGQPRTPYSGSASIVSMLLLWLVLYCGDFFK